MFRYHKPTMFNLFSKLLLTWLMVDTVNSLNYAKFETRSRLQVASDGGYTDLVVAIGKTVVENSELVDSVKDVVTSFSRNLHQLTGLYVKNARILVPSSWTTNTDQYSKASWETFENSDIRVDNVGVSADGNQRRCAHAPFTPKPTQCGSPGRYIVVTPDFIQSSDVADDFGGHDKALIREWAKYRWGIFDESPSKTDPHFYASSSGDIEGTRCSKMRKGSLETTSGRMCRIMMNGYPDDSCRFIDEESKGSSSQHASLMYRQYLEGIDRFCDTEAKVTAPRLIHNIEAPNSQNRHCDRLSAWEVFREHSDFASIGQQPWIPPTFSTSRRSAGEVVLVLDKSGSMKLNDRIGILRQAAYNFITRVIPNGARLGIVEFNEISKVNDARAPLTVIDEDTRQDLVELIPSTFVSGDTSIGAGVQRGFSVLADDLNSKASGGQMIVISDGKETNRPKISDILMSNTIELSQNTIHTVAVGPEVDESLETLANYTGGRHFHHSDFSTTLFDVFSQFGFDDSLRRSTEIYSQSDSLRGLSSASYEVMVDSSIDGNVLFLVGTNSTESVMVSVKPPAGPDLFAQSTGTEPDDFRLFSITATNAMVGIWTLTITNRDTVGKQVSIVVDGGLSTTSPPLLVEAQWGIGSMVPPDVQTLYATVTKGYIPVVGATVEAFVTINQRQVLQVLYDDGVGADVRPNDGIYSAFFTKVGGSGRYGAKVVVTGVDSRTNILTSECLGESAPDSDVITARSFNTDIATGAFQRVVDAGSFKCVDESECLRANIPSKYGPAKVTDLRIENIDLATSTADLVFTSPGADLMDGTATSYDIHYSRSFGELHKMYTATPVIRDSPSSNRVYFSNGLGQPRQARRREILSLTLPPEKGNFSYVFALTATDSNGLVSPISNFASMSARYLGSPFAVPMVSSPPAPKRPTTEGVGGGLQDNKFTSNSNNGDQFPWYFILIALIALIIFLLLLVTFVLRRRQGRKPDENILAATPSISSGQNAFTNPALHATSDSSVHYATSVATANDPYSAVVSSAKRMKQKDFDIPPTYDSHYFVTAPPTQPYGIPSSQIRHAPDGYESYQFVTAPPTSPYGIPSSQIKHTPTTYDDEDIAALKAGKKPSNELAESNHYEATSTPPKRTGTYSRENIRHSGIISAPYNPTGDEIRRQASIVSAVGAHAGHGGSNIRFYGVQPQADAIAEASVKSRGNKASQRKVPRR